MFSGDASHSRRLFFRPALGSLPSARHCSHVCGFLKSNFPFLPARNCVRGIVRSHTWHVSGFAAASLELCSFNRSYPLGCPLGHVGEHSLHFIFISSLVRWRHYSGQKKARPSNLPHCSHVSRACVASWLRFSTTALLVLPPSMLALARSSLGMLFVSPPSSPPSLP